MQLLVDGTALVVYVDERVALSGRIYDRREGGLGLFVTEGEGALWWSKDGQPDKLLRRAA